MAPLRLMIYDRTCAGRGLLPGLSLSWRVGGALYGALGRLDAWKGVASWEEGLEWLAEHRAPEPLGEIQFWGHGRWGCAHVAGAPLNVSALEPGHRLQPVLGRIRARLSGAEALWWFRTCETFGRAEGHAFAQAWTAFFGCRAAGHTFVIGPFQSGLHSLRPGQTPGWSVEEGTRAVGEPRRNELARGSGPRAPNTITCLQGEIPAGY